MSTVPKYVNLARGETPTVQKRNLAEKNLRTHQNDKMFTIIKRHI